MRTLLLLLILVCGVSSAQDSKVSPAKSEAKANSQQKTAAQPTPTVVNVKSEVNAHPTNKDSKSENAHPKEEITAWEATFWAAIIAGGALAVAIGQFVYFGRQLHVMSRTLEANKTSADAALNQSNSVMLAERAYIKMSHRKPGFVLVSKNQFAWLTPQIKNYGNTPGEITDALMSIAILPNLEALPNVPAYVRAENHPVGAQAFLVSGEELGIPFPFSLGRQAISEIESATKLLFVFGYVDYVDAFKIPHRAGYGRIYEPQNEIRANFRSDEDFEGRNNLVYITKRNYNYDRERTPDEGCDWVLSPTEN